MGKTGFMGETDLAGKLVSWKNWFSAETGLTDKLVLQGTILKLLS